MKKILPTIFLHMIALFFSQLAITKESLAIVDNEALNIYSNSQKLDLSHDTITFTGNVIVTQNNIQLTADKVVVKNIKNEQNKDVIAYGSPVKFLQHIHPNKSISGRANKLIYSTKKNSAILTGDAHLSHEGSVIDSQSIYYNITDRQVCAKSAINRPVKTTIIPNQLSE